MSAFLDLALAWYTVPVTVLFGAVVVYWIIVCFGALDMSSLDFNWDVDAEVDLDVDGPVDIDIETAPEISGTGLGMAVLRFLNFGKVPVMIIVTAMVFALWPLTLIANDLLNKPGTVLIAIPLLLGNFILSALIAKLVTTPLKPVFESMNRNYDTHLPIIGSEGAVRSLTVTAEGGQLEVDREGASVLVSVKISEGQEPLKRGDRALIVEAADKPETYIVRALAPDLTQEGE